MADNSPSPRTKTIFAIIFEATHYDISTSYLPISNASALYDSSNASKYIPRPFAQDNMTHTALTLLWG